MSGKRRPRSRWSNTPPPPRVSQRPSAPAEDAPDAAPAEQPSHHHVPTEPPSPDLAYDEELASEPLPGGDADDARTERVALPPAPLGAMDEPPEEREREAPIQDSIQEEDPDEEQPDDGEELAPRSEPARPSGARAAHEDGAVAARPGGAPSWATAVLALAAIAGVAFFLARGRATRRAVPEPARAAAVALDAPSSAPSSVPIAFTAPAASAAPPEEDASVGDRARYERGQAVHALEGRDFPRALELAQHAVDDDPAEAEGWLILGAAHLYRGEMHAAHDTFKGCVEHAKSARRDECAALLKQ